MEENQDIHDNKGKKVEKKPKSNAEFKVYAPIIHIPDSDTNTDTDTTAKRKKRPTLSQENKMKWYIETLELLRPFLEKGYSLHKAINIINEMDKHLPEEDQSTPIKYDTFHDYLQQHPRLLALVKRYRSNIVR